MIIKNSRNRNLAYGTCIMSLNYYSRNLLLWDVCSERDWSLEGGDGGQEGEGPDDGRGVVTEILYACVCM